MILKKFKDIYTASHSTELMTGMWESDVESLSFLATLPPSQIYWSGDENLLN